jgi:cytochrome c oxidase subunit 4
MFIATIKASTVVMYYMHLKWDHIIYKIFLAVIIALFVSFIGLLVIDYALR